MGPRFRTLLENQRIFRSCDLGETRAFLRTKEFRFETAARREEPLDVQINGVYLPGIYVGYIQYGAEVTVRTNPQRPDFWVQIPIRGRIETTVGRDSFACDNRHAAISLPTRGIVMRSEAGSTRLNLSLTRDSLTRQLAALLGRPPEAPLEFAPTLSLTEGYGRTLTQCLHWAIAEFERDRSILHHPAMMSLYEQFIMLGLLLSQPHNYVERLERPAGRPAPRDLRRAIEYIHQNLASPVTLADIVEASRVSGRSLLQHFLDTEGVSPMRFVRNARLDQARSALQRADSEESVTQIAADWGFSHMGRFSSQYRERFGETPSETLGKRRRPHRS